MFLVFAVTKTNQTINQNRGTYQTNLNVPSNEVKKIEDCITNELKYIQPEFCFCGNVCDQSFRLTTVYALFL